ncbi:MAG: YjbE family putative metal transport protein [Hyphomicrobium sp.]
MEWLTQDVFAMLAAAEAELENLVSTDWWQQNFIALLNITMIDLVLAGDNAIIVGLAASRVAPEMRTKVIFWGITAAVFLRIFFAAITIQLLTVIGLTLAGGLLLLFVCWKMYRQITTGNDHTQAAAAPEKPMGFWSAVGLITLADVSMSLDNVLAVAGAAKGSTLVLVIGLAVAIILMAVASRMIAGLLVKHPWITWIGLFIILWVALDMIYDGSHEIACEAYNFGSTESLWHAIGHRLGLT